MYRLLDVSKIYRRREQEVIAFYAADLEIRAGDYLAVLGPSGSGKTTLLSLLGGTLSPTTGTLHLDGVSLYDVPVAVRARLRRERIGFLFQSFNLVGHLSAVENVELSLYLARRSAAQQRTRAIELLSQVGLGNRLEHKPCELSVGQQQRVAVARMLANDPEIILADEPTGNLDADSRAAVLDFLDQSHRQGRTIVLVTHDPVAAARATTTLRLLDGCIDASAGVALKAA
jgi:putative ABC transport system ATP-binding protein